MMRSLADYITHMARDGTYGDQITLYAAANLYNIDIQIASSLRVGGQHAFNLREILHINVIQCQLVLMEYLSSFLRVAVLIYSILKLGYCISIPPWLHSTSVISSCTI